MFCEILGFGKNSLSVLAEKRNHMTIFSLRPSLEESLPPPVPVVTQLKRSVFKPVEGTSVFMGFMGL